MGRIAVTKRMGTDATVLPIQLCESGSDDTLNRRSAHRLIGSRGLRVVFAFGWEYPILVAMGFVVLSESKKGRLGQREHSILSALNPPKRRTSRFWNGYYYSRRWVIGVACGNRAGNGEPNANRLPQR